MREQKGSKMVRSLKLTNEQAVEAINLYSIKKISMDKIGKLFGVCSETIRAIILKNGVNIRDGSETLKLSTLFSFKKMSKGKAFLLGIIYGDGSISIRQDYVNITSGDLDILEKAKLVFGDKFKVSKIKNEIYYRGVIYSRKICEELFELFGLKNNKSDKLIFPILDDIFMPAFISGYLATDGCLSINSKDDLFRLSFYSCSEDFLNTLNDYICSKIELPKRKLYVRTNMVNHFGKKPLYTLSFNGSKAKAACKYIFSDNNFNLRSDRKYGIYEKTLSPHSFADL